MHYYSFDVKAYQSHTGHLDEMEDLCYRRMIDWCYLHESPLPKDVQKIAKLIRMRTHCERIADVLQEFWIEEEEGFFHDKINDDIAHYRNKSAQAKAAAEARWNKKKLKNKQLPRGSKKVKTKNADAIRTQSERNANKELIINNQEIPEWLNFDKWQEWLVYRKAKEKPVSDMAAKKQINLLKKYNKDIQGTVIDQSIANDWQGLFPPKETNNAKSKSDKSAANRTAENIQKELGQKSAG